MNNREKCIAILNTFAEAQLANIVTILQSVRELIREATANPEEVTEE